MNKKFFILSFFFSLLVFVAPFFASAAQMPGIPYWGPFVTCAREAGCSSLDELIQTVLNVISFGITITLFFAAPVLFAWGGILILISGASPSKREQGKKILTGTFIGVVIILTSFLIIKTFVSFLGIKGIGGFS